MGTYPKISARFHPLSPLARCVIHDAIDLDNQLLCQATQTDTVNMVREQSFDIGSTATDANTDDVDTRLLSNANLPLDHRTML